MKELFSDPKEDEYLSEFRQKIAQEMQDDIEQRKRELEKSRNGFIGTIAGIILAGLVSWFLLLPKFGYKSQTDIPVIRRPITPVKIQPNEPGGMDIQNQDKTVYALVEKKDVIDTKVESLLPQPEAPKLPTIVQEEEKLPSEAEPAAKEDESSDMEDLIEAVETTATQKVKIPEKLPVIDVNVQKAEAGDYQIKPGDDEKVKSDNAGKEMLATSPKVTGELASQTVTEERISPKVTAEGKYKVQLMASSNKDALEKGYQTFKGKYSVLKGLPYTIDLEKDGLYRLKVGAFGERKGAEDLCAEIKKAGGSCMVKE